MATHIASGAATADPWQLRMIKGDSALNVAAKEEAVVVVPANDANAGELSAGRQPPQFLPRFLAAPDGMEWS